RFQLQPRAQHEHRAEIRNGHTASPMRRLAGDEPPPLAGGDATAVVADERTRVRQHRCDDAGGDECERRNRKRSRSHRRRARAKTTQATATRSMSPRLPAPPGAAPWVLSRIT